MTATTLEETRELTATDRCDACGAQAYVQVVLNSGNDLYFCGHHARENEEGLRAIASEWNDQTDRLK